MLAPIIIQSDTHDAVRLRCPHCRHMATFEPPSIRDASNNQTGRSLTVFGLRRCPNPDCYGVVFFVSQPDNGGIRHVFPPELIDFDATSLPEGVLSGLEKSAKCLSAGCYRATALMVRRTLELVRDEQGAAGGDLKQRLRALGTKAVVPGMLFDGLDNLRLLGNDAAHVDAKDYEEVGEDEASLALDLTKELLKAVYQYGSLVARLEALKTRTAEEP